jgi:hypothetical protein
MNKLGDIVEFKRKGFVSFFLGGILKLFDRKWDGWGWHLAVVWEVKQEGCYVLESLAGGVEINYYPNEFFTTEPHKCRVYTILTKKPTKKFMSKFLKTHINKKYDVAIYFWTALQYLIRHYFNHRIPRLLDDRYTCWELVFEFLEEAGKPIVSKYDCPMITDFMKAVQDD